MNMKMLDSFKNKKERARSNQNYIDQKKMKSKVKLPSLGSNMYIITTSTRVLQKSWKNIKILSFLIIYCLSWKNRWKEAFFKNIEKRNSYQVLYINGNYHQEDLIKYWNTKLVSFSIKSFGFRHFYV